MRLENSQNVVRFDFQGDRFRAPSQLDSSSEIVIEDRDEKTTFGNFRPEDKYSFVNSYLEQGGELAIGDGTPKIDRESELERLSDKAEMAAKILEAEYVHENSEKFDLEEFERNGDSGCYGILADAGTENFERLINGAKASISQEDYIDGLRYLELEGADFAESKEVVSFAEGRGYSFDEKMESVSRFKGF